MVQTEGDTLAVLFPIKSSSCPGADAKKFGLRSRSLGRRLDDGAIRLISLFLNTPSKIRAEGLR